MPIRIPFGLRNENTMEQENLHWQDPSEAEEEINLLELAGRLWRRRKVIIMAGIIGAVVGLVVAFSLPKEYSVTVKLSRESNKSSTSGLSSAASMLGFGNYFSGSDGDALSMLLYPEILASNPFALELYNMPVTTEKGERMPLNEYMGTQRVVWWKWLMGLPVKAVRTVIGIFRREDDSRAEDHILDPFRLSLKETSQLNAIKKSMTVAIDRNTAVATITVTLQDPLVSATLADSVVTKLQHYISDYRTKKAVNDYEYLENLYRERQEEYYDAQQRYATYVDGNRSLYTQRSMVERERLQNDMNQAYQIYSQVASQLQVARAKVQEDKPVFVVVNPATVPIKAASPNKKMILVVFVFLACVIAAAWALWGEDLWASVKAAAASGDVK